MFRIIEEKYFIDIWSFLSDTTQAQIHRLAEYTFFVQIGFFCKIIHIYTILEGIQNVLSLYFFFYKKSENVYLSWKCVVIRWTVCLSICSYYSWYSFLFCLGETFWQVYNYCDTIKKITGSLLNNEIFPQVNRPDFQLKFYQDSFQTKIVEASVLYSRSKYILILSLISC